MYAKKRTRLDNVYRYISSFYASHGYPPSVRDIAAALDIKSTSTVHCDLRQLEEEGKITRSEKKTRTYVPSVQTDVNKVFASIKTINSFCRENECSECLLNSGAFCIARSELRLKEAEA